MNSRQASAGEYSVERIVEMMDETRIFPAKRDAFRQSLKLLRIQPSCT